LGFYDIEITGENHTGFRYFQSNIVQYLFPKGQNSFRRFVPNQYLKNIDGIKNIAIENVSPLFKPVSSTFYADDRFKSLSSTHLDEQSKRRDNTFVYNHIIKTLIHRYYRSNNYG
jgi:hypothetical protein